MQRTSQHWVIILPRCLAPVSGTQKEKEAGLAQSSHLIPFSWWQEPAAASDPLQRGILLRAQPEWGRHLCKNEGLEPEQTAFQRKQQAEKFSQESESNVGPLSNKETVEYFQRERDHLQLGAHGHIREYLLKEVAHEPICLQPTLALPCC